MVKGYLFQVIPETTAHYGNLVEHVLKIAQNNCKKKCYVVKWKWQYWKNHKPMGKRNVLWKNRNGGGLIEILWKVIGDGLF